MTVKAVAAILAGVAVALSISLWRQARHGASLEAQLQEARRSATAMKDQISALEAERDSLREAQGLPPASPVPVIPPARKSGSAEDAAAVRAELSQQLEEKEARIAAAVKAREDIEGQMRDFQARLEAATRELEQSSRAERDLREQIQSQERRTATAEKEAGEATLRAEKLDAANRELRRQADDASRRFSTISKASDQLEDLNRRREVLVNNLLRRYREVTDLYRNLSLQTDAPRDELLRIQTAISLAEEDMRQLQALNAQAGRIQKSVASSR